ncbi:hypothetical protein ACF0HZ_00015 (plasmid) [Leuconostoc suionicum]|uniref:hypothetical protein n=1 Tax=Leuconostoc suionicum TaxID=1511761 RepID=UPI00374A7E3D
MLNPRINFDKNLVRKIKSEIILNSKDKENKPEGNLSGEIELKNSIDKKNSRIKSTAIVELKLILNKKNSFKFYVQLESFFTITSEKAEFKLLPKEREFIAIHMSQKVSNILSNSFELATNHPLIYSLKSQFINAATDKNKVKE